MASHNGLDTYHVMLLHETEEAILDATTKCAIVCRAATLKARQRELVEEKMARLEDVVRVRALLLLADAAAARRGRCSGCVSLEALAVFAALLVAGVRAVLFDLANESAEHGPCLSDTYGAFFTTAAVQRSAGSGFAAVGADALLPRDSPYRSLMLVRFRGLLKKLWIMLDMETELARLVDRDLDEEQREQEARAAAAVAAAAAAHNRSGKDRSGAGAAGGDGTGGGVGGVGGRGGSGLLLLDIDLGGSGSSSAGRKPSSEGGHDSDTTDIETDEEGSLTCGSSVVSEMSPYSRAAAAVAVTTPGSRAPGAAAFAARRYRSGSVGLLHSNSVRPSSQAWKAEAAVAVAAAAAAAAAEAAEAAAAAGATEGEEDEDEDGSVDGGAEAGDAEYEGSDSDSSTASSMAPVS